MKLIFVNRYFHPDISATSQLLTDLALDQARRGHEVHVVASRQLYEDADANLAEEEVHEGVRIHRVGTSRFGRANLAGRAVDYATFHAAAGRELRALAAGGDVIVAKTDPPLIASAAARAARDRGARLVNWVQDIFPEVAEALGTLPAPLAALARASRDRSLREAAANVVVGARMAERLAAACPGIALQVIPNWADGTLIRPVAPEDNALRRDWLPDTPFVVGYSGNMGRVHDMETLLGACKALRDERDLAFLFVGGGSQRAPLEDEARRSGLTGVAFRPYQPRERLAESLSVPDVHLVTLKPAIEGLVVPSKFYAIAAAARPVIFVGDREGEIARLVARGGCGVAIAAGDAAGLASAIRALRGDPGRVRDMGARARALFEREFERGAALEQWNRVLHPAA